MGTGRWDGLEADKDWGQQPGLAGNLTTYSPSSCTDLLEEKEHAAWDKRNPGAAAWERQPPMGPACPLPLAFAARERTVPHLWP